jgi:hypothetical protein
MIVMGLANLYGAGKNWLMKDRLESEVPNFLTRSRPTRLLQKINLFRFLRPSQWHWLFYKEAGVINSVTKATEEGYKMRSGWRFILQASRPLVYGKILHATQRWEDKSGLMPRFAPGKTTRILRMPTSWKDQLLEGYQVQSAEKILGQLLNHQLTVKDRTVSDQLYNRIASLKEWVAKMSPEATPDQDERLLGVFWVAQDRGVLGGGAPDILLKWNNEKRYEKLNEYFAKKKIPLQVSEYGEFQFQE